MITRCMSCRRSAPAWAFSFIQGRSSGAGPGDAVRRTALMLCEGCNRNKARQISDEYASAGWQLQRVTPILRARDGSTRGRTAAAAVTAAAPHEAAPPRPWWSLLLGRLNPVRS